MLLKRKKMRVVRILWTLNQSVNASSANTLNIESISKSENLAKPSIVIPSSTETSSADENKKKLDMILSEIEF